MSAAEFINPKSMMTPGIASTAILLVANTLNLHFELKAAITALALSFLIGLVVFLAEQMKLIERVIYYIVNSLILFSMAVGGNQGIVSLSAPVNPPDDISLTAQSVNQDYLRQVAYQRVLNENLADRLENLQSVIASGTAESLDNTEIHRALEEYEEMLKLTDWYLSTLEPTNEESAAAARPAEADKTLFKSWF